MRDTPMDPALQRVISAESLADALAAPASDRPGLSLVDLRDAAAFDTAHIRGARSLDKTLLNRSEPPFNGLLPDLGTAQRLVQSIDLREGQQVVAIDGGRATEAARLAWVLEAFALPPVAWLDGGMAAWQAAGLPVAGGEAAPAVRTDPSQDDRPLATPMLRADNRVSADELLAELNDPQLRILDVRGAAEYAGSDVRSAAGGHVPGALHYEWTDQLAADGTLLPHDELRAQLQSMDVQPEHRVVVYCQSHQRSAVTWQVLRALGYDSVRGLDGAWSVWGNRADLPKRTAEQAGPIDDNA